MRKISEQELKDILDKHGKWLKGDDGGEKADLSSTDLSSADLRYADLRYADLSSANLHSANLHSADLRFANLRSANLRSADLRVANLHSADLRVADLRVADLRFADLRFAGLIMFQHNQHMAYFTYDGTLTIGCIVMPITEWVLGFEEIGKVHGYSDIEIKSYGNFIKNCLEIYEQAIKGSE